ncbi:hypothetical protein CGU42_32950 [Pseudomonas aeruginosa]|nr:hypothetical protein CGU42_32950 [Pseudomonas aeruginosa]RPS13070.1 hypothetical protein IPC1015_33740 [Pseudomonas aeruginosa]RPW15264.1 hypothetical protein IPC752_27280 [Pseudomonas aeruginosa]
MHLKTQESIMNCVLKQNLLSQLKRQRDPALILQMNEMTNADRPAIVDRLNELLEKTQENEEGA